MNRRADNNVYLGCENVVVVPQYQGTCWFNAVLMMLFYSEATRGVLLRASGVAKLEASSRKSGRALGSLFAKVLGLYKRPEEALAHRWYDRHPPEEFLMYLNRYDPKKFEKQVYRAANGTYQAETGSFGHKTYRYLYHLLKMLGVDNVMLDAVPTTKNKVGPFRLAIGKAHSGGGTLSASGVKRRIASRPATLLVAMGGQSLSKWKDRPEHHFLGRRVYTGLPKTLVFGPATYVLDSVGLSNVNSGVEYVDGKGRVKTAGGHAIAGVTCNGGRFIYSGWMSKTVDASSDVDPSKAKKTDKPASKPCPLMPFDWTTNRSNFYVTSRACDVQLDRPKPGTMVFNAAWGSRTLVYVRKDLVRYKRDGLARAMQARREGDRREAVGIASRVARQAVANAFARKQRLA